MAVTYPRRCHVCDLTYAHKSSFSRHLSSGKCASHKAGHKTIKSQIVNAQNVTVINQASDTVDVKILEEKLALESQLESMRCELEAIKKRHGETKDPLTDIIYIVQTPHSFAGGLNVFKVGKTKNMMKRKLGYPKDTHIIAQFACIDADILEKKLLDRKSSRQIIYNRTIRNAGH